MALMTFEQLDRSIDADSDSDDELAEQAHMYRSRFSHLQLTTPHDIPSAKIVSLNPTVMTDKSRSPTSPSFPSTEMANLNITPASPPPPPRPAPPPRPSAMSKPQSQLSPHGKAPANGDDSDEDGFEEDENDPFADRNAVITPKVERSEPTW